MFCGTEDLTVEAVELGEVVWLADSVKKRSRVAASSIFAWSSLSDSESDSLSEKGIASRARTSEVVMETFSSRASMRAKGQWCALWPVDLQIEQRRASVQAVA